MSQDNEKDEPSVDEILSSIKDVIASDKDAALMYTFANVFEGGDISIDNVIREAVKDSIEDWFSRNLRPIVEESVKQEISKLFKKRN